MTGFSKKMSDLYYGSTDSIAQYLPYFYDIAVECPYGLPQTAVYRQQQFVSLPDELFGLHAQVNALGEGQDIIQRLAHAPLAAGAPPGQSWRKYSQL